MRSPALVDTPRLDDPLVAPEEAWPSSTRHAQFLLDQARRPSLRVCPSSASPASGCTALHDAGNPARLMMRQRQASSVMEGTPLPT